MFLTRSALINRVMVLVGSVEWIDITSAVWKYNQIVLARVEFQYDGACGVVPTLRSICILMDHVIASADIAEVEFLIIHVGSLGLTSSVTLRGLLRCTAKTRVIITRTRGISKQSKGQDRICQRILNILWSCHRELSIHTLCDLYILHPLMIGQSDGQSSMRYGQDQQHKLQVQQQHQQ